MKMSLVISESNTKEQPTIKTEVISALKFAVFLILLFIFLRFSMSLAIISGESMAPTFEDGSLVIANRLYFEPEAGNIVLFSDDNGFQVIKRVIGMQGDQISIENGIVIVNGVELKESYTQGIPNDMAAQVVPKGHYFLLGDNRTPGASLDSRDAELGTIPLNRISGEMMLALNPFRIGNGY